MNASRTVLWVLPLCLAALPASAELTVWSVRETARVLREDGPPAGASAAVHLSAARNEWVSFQVFARSDTGAKALDLKADDLSGPGGAVLGAADADLYRENLMELAVPSARNDQFKPGWYPDGLIPFRHPLTKAPLEGGRLKAVPFDLPGAQTHGFWVDLYVPPDARPGEYRGTYRVTAEGGAAVEVPVRMAVWNFALPATPTMRTSFGSPAQRLRIHYRDRAKAGKERPIADADWPAVEEQCAAMLSAHRIAASPPAELLALRPGEGASYSMPDEQVAALRKFVDTYHVNCIQLPSIRAVVKDPQAEEARLRGWLAAWDRVAKKLERPDVVLYLYLWDEPNDKEAYEGVRKWGTAIRATGTAVKVLVVEQPQTQDPGWGDLHGAVDIWCPLFPIFEEAPAAERLKLGESVWTYTALCQRKPTPWWEIDFPLLNYRVPAWPMFRYRIDGLLYWGGMTFWKQVDDPWSDPKTLDRRAQGKGQLYNGEGSLVYPGRACGYEGIAPSLRLKALRDAVEDYEYLVLLEKAGRRAEAIKLVDGVARSFFDWEKDPAALEKARESAGAALSAGK